MRVILAAIFLALSMEAAHAQTSSPLTAPPSKVTYFLVDASGSMVEEKAEAERKLEAAVTLLDVGSWKSITFFGGASPPGSLIGCDDDVAVAMATPPEIALPVFPVLGGKDDRTAIGNGLEAIFREGGEDATVFLITDGAEECETNFASIRARYPRAEINVLQVGSNPNAELGLLESQAAGISSLAPMGDAASALVVFESPLLQVFPESGRQTGGQWKAANWLEKYLWILAYLCLLLGSYRLSRSFQKKEDLVKQAIDELEQRRHQQANQDKPSGEPPLPALLKIETVEAAGRAYTRQAYWCFAYAIVLGLPLALLDGVEQMHIGAAGLVLLCVYLLVFGSKVFEKKGTSGNKRPPKFKLLYQLKNLLFMPVIGMFAIGAIVYFLANYEAARGAAWVPLSSGFAAALTLLASAPLIFSGSRWWGLQRAQHTYHVLSDGAARDRIRSQEEDARKRKEDWDSYRSRIREVKFPNPIKFWPFLPARREAIFKEQIDVVVERVKELVVQSGGDTPTQEANEHYRKLLSDRRLEQFVSTATGLAKLASEEELTLLSALATALQSKDRRKIADAFSTLARSIARQRQNNSLQLPSDNI